MSTSVFVRIEASDAAVKSSMVNTLHFGENTYMIDDIEAGIRLIEGLREVVEAMKARASGEGE